MFSVILLFLNCKQCLHCLYGSYAPDTHYIHKFLVLKLQCVLSTVHMYIPYDSMHKVMYHTVSPITYTSFPFGLIRMLTTSRPVGKHLGCNVSPGNRSLKPLNDDIIRGPLSSLLSPFPIHCIIFFHTNTIFHANILPIIFNSLVATSFIQPNRFRLFQSRFKHRSSEA